MQATKKNKERFYKMPLSLAVLSNLEMEVAKKRSVNARPRPSALAIEPRSALHRYAICNMLLYTDTP